MTLYGILMCVCVWVRCHGDYSKIIVYVWNVTPKRVNCINVIIICRRCDNNLYFVYLWRKWSIRWSTLVNDMITLLGTILFTKLFPYRRTFYHLRVLRIWLIRLTANVETDDCKRNKQIVRCHVHGKDTDWKKYTFLDTRTHSCYNANAYVPPKNCPQRYLQKELQWTSWRHFAYLFKSAPSVRSICYLHTCSFSVPC